MADRYAKPDKVKEFIRDRFDEVDAKVDELLDLAKEERA